MIRNYFKKVNTNKNQMSQFLHFIKEEIVIAMDLEKYEQKRMK